MRNDPRYYERPGCVIFKNLIRIYGGIYGKKIKQQGSCKPDSLKRPSGLRHASGKEIVEKALRYCDEDSRISYIVVNTAGEAIHISMVLDTPEERVTSEEELLSNGGYILAYVWNATYPECSELGDIYLSREADQRIHRRG